MGKEKGILIKEEEYLKGKEEERRERLGALSSEKWAEERKSMNEEVFLLRQRIDRQEAYLEEVIGQMREEVDMFRQARGEVERRVVELKERIHEVEKVMQGMEGKEADKKEGESEVVVKMGQDVEFLKEKLIEEQNMHDEELRMLQKAFEEKIRAQVMREEVLNQQVEELKIEVNETEQAFESYKYLNQKEINNMVSELNTLRRHSNVRQDQVNRREGKLKEEINKLKKQLEGR